MATNNNEVKQFGSFIYVEPNVNINNELEPVSLEELCVYSELKVEYLNTKRETTYDKNNNTFILISKINDHHSHVSLYSGVKKTNDPNNNDAFLSTLGYGNYTYKSREENKNEGTDEMFGVESIEVSYNSFAVPEVNVKLTDIKGAALMAAEEYAHDANGNLIQDIKLSSKFLSCFFTVPYPKFELYIKGFYGKPVYYDLTCADFKSTFNSQTGNYDVVIKLVGYSFSLISDVTMCSLLAAPYSDYYGKEYWNNAGFTLDNGVSMPKLQELVNKWNQNVKTFQEIINAVEIKNEELHTKFNSTIHVNGIYNLFLDGFKTSNLNAKVNNGVVSFTIKTDEEPAFDFDGYITKFISNFTNGELNDSVIKKLDNARKLGGWTKSIKGKLATYTYNFRFISEAQSKTRTEIHKNYADEIKKSAESINDKLKEALGFTPSLYNMTKICFAHLETFLYMFERVKKESEPNVSLFPKIITAKLNDNSTSSIEENWLGEFEDYNNREEVKFVEGYLKGIAEGVEYNPAFAEQQSDTPESSSTTNTNTNEQGFDVNSLPGTLGNKIKLFPWDIVDEPFNKDELKNDFKKAIANRVIRVFCSNYYDAALYNDTFAKYLADEDILKITKMYPGGKKEILQMTTDTFKSEIILEVKKLLKQEGHSKIKELQRNMVINNVLNGYNYLLGNSQYAYINFKEEGEGEVFSPGLFKNYSHLNDIYKTFYPNGTLKFRLYDNDELTFYNKAKDKGAAIKKLAEMNVSTGAVYATSLGGYAMPSHKLETDVVRNHNMFGDYGYWQYYRDMKNTTNDNVEKHIFLEINPSLWQADYARMAINRYNAFYFLINIPFFGESNVDKKLEKTVNFLSGGQNRNDVKNQYLYNIPSYAKICPMMFHAFVLAFLYGCYKEIDVCKKYRLYFHKDALEVANQKFLNWVNNKKIGFAKIVECIQKMGKRNYKNNLIYRFGPDSYCKYLTGLFIRPSLMVMGPPLMFEKLYVKGLDNLTAYVKKHDEIHNEMNIYINRICEPYEVKFQEAASQLSSAYVSNAIAENQSAVEKQKELSLTKFLKFNVYRYLKQIWDRWVIDGKNGYDNWKVSDVMDKANHRIHFIDPSYNNIGKTTFIQIDKFIDLIQGCKNQDDLPFLSFLSHFYSENNCTMFNVQNFLDTTKKENIKDCFMPYSLYDTNFNSLKKYSDLVILNNYQPSESSKDSFDLNDDIGLPEQYLRNNTFYKIPAFGVTYGMQNQNYFINIDVDMESPNVTDQSIQATYQIADENAKIAAGETSVKIRSIGQDMYKVYANHAYQCTVTMMGCAWIQPLMYFQLLNVPLFRGSYIIHKVSHTISSNNMITKFTGTRIAKHEMRKLQSSILAIGGDSAYYASEEEVKMVQNQTANINSMCPYRYVNPDIVMVPKMAQKGEFLKSLGCKSSFDSKSYFAYYYLLIANALGIDKDKIEKNEIDDDGQIIIFLFIVLMINHLDIEKLKEITEKTLNGTNDEGDSNDEDGPNDEDGSNNEKSQKKLQEKLHEYIMTFFRGDKFKGLFQEKYNENIWDSYTLDKGFKIHELVRSFLTWDVYNFMKFDLKKDGFNNQLTNWAMWENNLFHMLPYINNVMNNEGSIGENQMILWQKKDEEKGDLYFILPKPQNYNEKTSYNLYFRNDTEPHNVFSIDKDIEEKLIECMQETCEANDVLRGVLRGKTLHFYHGNSDYLDRDVDDTYYHLNIYISIDYYDDNVMFTLLDMIVQTYSFYLSKIICSNYNKGLSHIALKLKSDIQEDLEIIWAHEGKRYYNCAFEYIDGDISHTGDVKDLPIDLFKIFIKKYGIKKNGKNFVDMDNYQQQNLFGNLTKDKFLEMLNSLDKVKDIEIKECETMINIESKGDLTDPSSYETVGYQFYGAGWTVNDSSTTQKEAFNDWKEHVEKDDASRDLLYSDKTGRGKGGSGKNAIRTMPVELDEIEKKLLKNGFTRQSSETPLEKAQYVAQFASQNYLKYATTNGCAKAVRLFLEYAINLKINVSAIKTKNTHPPAACSYYPWLYHVGYKQIDFGYSKELAKRNTFQDGDIFVTSGLEEKYKKRKLDAYGHIQIYYKGWWYSNDKYKNAYVYNSLDSKNTNLKTKDRPSYLFRAPTHQQKASYPTAEGTMDYSKVCIMIDNGHDVDENCCGNGYCEGRWTREIARGVVKGLEARGFTNVFLTAEEDKVGGKNKISTRVSKVKEKFKDFPNFEKKQFISVSIHTNASSDSCQTLKGQQSGWSAWTGLGYNDGKRVDKVPRETSNKLAKYLVEAAKAHGFPILSGKDGKFEVNGVGLIGNKNNDGVFVFTDEKRKGMTSSFPLDCPAVITENFFHDNPGDYENFIKTRQADIVAVHVEGIKNFIDNEYKEFVVTSSPYASSSDDVTRLGTLAKFIQSMESFSPCWYPDAGGYSIGFGWRSEFKNGKLDSGSKHYQELIKTYNFQGGKTRPLMKLDEALNIHIAIIRDGYETPVLDFLRKNNRINRFGQNQIEALIDIAYNGPGCVTDTKKYQLPKRITADTTYNSDSGKYYAEIRKELNIGSDIKWGETVTNTNFIMGENTPCPNLGKGPNSTSTYNLAGLRKRRCYDQKWFTSDELRTKVINELGINKNTWKPPTNDDCK